MLFGHSAMMMRHGCYIDDAGLAGGKGGPADHQDTDIDKDDQNDDAGGETGGDADDPDQQKRKSKQDPKVDAAFAEARRAKEEADRLKAQLADYQELEKEYEEYGLRGPKAIAEAVRAEKSKNAQANANEDAQFEAWLVQEVNKHRVSGESDLAIDAFVRGCKADYRAYKLERKQAQDEAQRKKEKELEKQEREKEKQSKAAEKVVGMVMDQYKDLRKEFPDLVPAGCKNFNELMDKVDPAIRDKMLQSGLTLEDAFHIVNRRKIAKRLAAMDDEKEKDNADRSTSSGREKGDASGGTYGLTPRQQALAKEGGMSNKEYASLIKHVKK
ncbi:MAG: hypothetical protein ACYC4H_00825 [Desulfocucumaceae bacterium]